jgi:muconate cycloisomerase
MTVLSRAPARAAVEAARLDVLEVRLPFRTAFGHSLARRTESRNVWVRVALRDGTVGYGEAVPRAYVTGETVESCVRDLSRTLDSGWWRRGFDSLEHLADVLDARYEVEGPDSGGAARCALELALLDAAGKASDRSVGELLGRRAREVEYSAVLPFVRSPLKLLALALKVRSMGIRAVKVKVGQGARPDDRALRYARWAVGPHGDVRVDANGCWSAEEALEAIAPMFTHGISAVEQPVPGEDLDGMAQVAAALEPRVIADESFHTPAGALHVIDRKAADVLNIRLSKCGGLLTARRILREAEARGVRCQLGAQVGESGVLTAAGRAFACAYPELLYREGAAGRFLLQADPVVQDTTFGRGGLAPALRGPGLGITVDEERLAACSRVLLTVR